MPYGFNQGFQDPHSGYHGDPAITTDQIIIPGFKIANLVAGNIVDKASVVNPEKFVEVLSRVGQKLVETQSGSSELVRCMKSIEKGSPFLLFEKVLHRRPDAEDGEIGSAQIAISLVGEDSGVAVSVSHPIFPLSVPYGCANPGHRSPNFASQIPAANSLLINNLVDALWDSFCVEDSRHESRSTFGFDNWEEHTHKA